MAQSWMLTGPTHFTCAPPMEKLSPALSTTLFAARTAASWLPLQ